MFSGSCGYVLKPNGYLGKPTSSALPHLSEESQGDAIEHRTLTLSIEVLAAQNVPLPLGDTKPSGFHPYVKCELHVETLAERTGGPIDRGGKAKEGEYKWRSRAMKGTEVNFGAEKVEFKEIPGVVEELSFLRYFHLSSLPELHYARLYWSTGWSMNTENLSEIFFGCESIKQATLCLGPVNLETLL